LQHVTGGDLSRRPQPRSGGIIEHVPVWEEPLRNFGGQQAMDFEVTIVSSNAVVGSFDCGARSFEELEIDIAPADEGAAYLVLAVISSSIDQNSIERRRIEAEWLRKVN